MPDPGGWLTTSRDRGEQRLLAAVADALATAVRSTHRIGGGDINDAWCLELEDASRVFLKSRADAPEGEYAAEAAGLAWLAEPGGLPVPEVVAVIDAPEYRGLVLEWVEPGRLDEAGEEELGRGLAAVHAAGAEGFDTLPPWPQGWATQSSASPASSLRFGGVELAIGSHSLGAPWSEHYASRLERLVGVGLERGRIQGGGARAVGRVIERMSDLAGPNELPARVHGDLWSGNVLAAADGRPWLIDPAAHGAHRELDLAMLELFGSVSPRTLAAYEEVRPLADGWRERVALWQLQPLLVHAILFGGSYGAAVERTAARYL